MMLYQCTLKVQYKDRRAGAVPMVRHCRCLVLAAYRCICPSLPLAVVLFFPFLRSLAIATATSAPTKGPQKTDKSWEEALHKAVGAQVLTWHLAELNSTAASLTALKAPRIDVLKVEYSKQ